MNSMNGRISRKLKKLKGDFRKWNDNEGANWKIE